MAICCISFNLYRTVAVNNILDDLLANPDQYSNFGKITADFVSHWPRVEVGGTEETTNTSGKVTVGNVT